MNIVWLDQANCQNPSLVGNKAANLSRLYADYLVPPGFCLTVTALTEHANIGELNETVTDAPTFAPALYTELAMAYRRLSIHCGEVEMAVAVRSSAADEDSSGASFAGQHKTYLNVTGIDAIAFAAAKCLRSARSTNALEYRRLSRLALDNIQLAVLVQKQIIAESSAVVFSADPLMGRDKIIINSAWGLGKSIVDGLVNPDSYAIRKSDFKIISRQIAEKNIMTVPDSTGTLEVEPPSASRNAPALTDYQVIELARTAARLEKDMGWPVDVECAYKEEKLYLLQCRPITVRI
jgi:phosphoenolpyruvate synthase/pyruvate phosphate dikinase